MIVLWSLLLLGLASPASVLGEFPDPVPSAKIVYEEQPDGNVTIDLFEPVPDRTSLVPVLGDFNPSPRLASCTRLGHGRFPVYGNCTRYLECQLLNPHQPSSGYVRRIVQCPLGLWYRGDITDCGVQDRAECPYGRLVPNPPEMTVNSSYAGGADTNELTQAWLQISGGSCSADGEFALPGCRGFYSCRDKDHAFHLYTYTCESGFRWDGDTCEPQESVQCEIPEEDTECTRQCVTGDKRTCRYTFIVEEYASMSIFCKHCPFTKTDCDLPGCVTAGGVSKPLVTINRRVPGPVIQACKGDTLEIEVQNRLPADGTTIHWHGIHQRETPYMDGVPYITQCPIPPGNTFRYRMVADISGTHLYHSHVGHQESDGMFGAMIIREPRNAEFGMEKRYDKDLPEHHVLVWHWFARPAEIESIDTRLQSMRREGFGFLINGKGSVKNIYGGHSGTPIPLPLATYDVTTGKRYRFRAIFNSGVHCPIQLSIDGHLLDILATDGRPVKQARNTKLVDSVFMSAGERVDFVPHPHWSVKPTNKSFYLRVRGLNDCDDQKNGAFQSAVLRYDGSSAAPSGIQTYVSSIRNGVGFNLNRDLKNPNNYFIQALPLIAYKNANPRYNKNIARKPDKIFYIKVGFEFYSMSEGIQMVLPQLNKISWAFPFSPPLTQPESVTNVTFCRPNAPRNCRNDVCHCPQILEINKGELVEIVLVDETGSGLGHPFHMHGFAYHVVAMHAGTDATSVAAVKRDNERGNIKKVFDGPLKDTVVVPTRGFTVIRFFATNPGFWFFHCHVSEHLARGMALVLQVGQHQDMLKPPPNFPRCGNFY